MLQSYLVALYPLKLVSKASGGESEEKSLVWVWEDSFEEARNFLHQYHPELVHGLERRKMIKFTKGKLHEVPLFTCGQGKCMAHDILQYRFYNKHY